MIYRIKPILVTQFSVANGNKKFLKCVERCVKVSYNFLQQQRSYTDTDGKIHAFTTTVTRNLGKKKLSLNSGTTDKTSNIVYQLKITIILRILA
jgi:hypothetical protein